VASLEKSIGTVLPPLFRKFLLTQTAGIRLGWTLEEDALMQLTGAREPISAGEFSFHLSKFLRLNPQFRPGYDPDDYDRDYRRGHLLAIADTPNGDQFAVMLSGADADAIVYLSHDIDDIHLYRVGDNLVSFLENYARLGFAGPEYWIWEQFTRKRTTPIDATSPQALKFLKALQKGQRSAAAEAQSKKADECARLAIYQVMVAPEAQLLLDAKKYKAYLKLVADYTDLLSKTAQARYEYLRKKHG
jgi:hypothetical protein